MTGRKGLFTALSGALALAIAQPAAAQICAGYPTAPGQTAIGLRASFPSGGNSVGAEFNRNFTNPLGVFASVNLLMPDADGADNVVTFGGGLAWELSMVTMPNLSLCPVAALSYSSQNDVSTLNIPLGFGVGTAFGQPDGMQILPFVIPQFVIARISADDVSTSDNNFGLGAGAFVKFSGVYGGVTLNKIFVEGSDVDWALQGGLTFPARLR